MKNLAIPFIKRKFHIIIEIHIIATQIPLIQILLILLIMIVFTIVIKLDLGE